jgi:hypothetical protein
MQQVITITTTLIIVFSLSSCVVVTNNELSYGGIMTPAQACILENHYLTSNEEAPDSLVEFIDKTNIDCNKT